MTKESCGCPMCPIEARDISAVLYNLLNRLNSETFPSCAIQKKWSSVCHSVEFLDGFTSEDEHVQRMLDMAVKVSGCRTMYELLSLRQEIASVLAPIRILSEKHFKECV